MSFAYWPAAETVERFNRQVERCGAPKRVGRGLGHWGKWLEGSENLLVERGGPAAEMGGL